MVHVAALEKTYQKTDEWIRDIMGELHTGDPEIAYSALHATLRALRDRLTIQENAQLGAQLPTVLRGLFGGRPVHHGSKHQRGVCRQAFIDRCCREACGSRR